jgi:hypothetical protein
LVFDLGDTFGGGSTHVSGRAVLGGGGYASASDQGGKYFVVDPFRVDEDAVAVEHHGLDHPSHVSGPY